jgi:hypothetical protein
MFVDTRYEHMVLDEEGVPLIVGTTMKVQELVAERLAWGWSPEELLLNHSYNKFYLPLPAAADGELING